MNTNYSQKIALLLNSRFGSVIRQDRKLHRDLVQSESLDELSDSSLQKVLSMIKVLEKDQ